MVTSLPGKPTAVRSTARGGAERLAVAVPLTLKPGKYIFRVTNSNVPYALGFWLRGDGIVNRATLPSVSGGGLCARNDEGLRNRAEGGGNTSIPAR